jgi:hypothetical protein
MASFSYRVLRETRSVITKERREELTQRLAELTEKLRALAGEENFIFDPSSLSLEQAVAYLEQIYAAETAPMTTLRALLAEAGITLPSPDALADDDLPALVERLLTGMAEFNCYIYNTDHLSDRALYEHLWEEVDVEDKYLPDACTEIDLLGRWRPADTVAWLTYYAENYERAEWAKENPRSPLPPRRPLPYHRDATLPGVHPDLSTGGAVGEDDSATLFDSLDALPRADAELPMPPAPESLSAKALSQQLWQLIDRLGDQRIYLRHTEHLPDRELYTHLRDLILTDQLQAWVPGANQRIDLAAPDGPEVTTWLTYYATSQQRKRWRKAHPTGSLPAHKEPLYHRADRLPTP